MNKFAFRFEPALWLGLIRAIVPTLLLFNYIDWTADQMAQFFITSEAALALIQRSVVTPNAKLSDATVEQAKDVPPGPKP
jgi:hypothetical protein